MTAPAQQNRLRQIPAVDALLPEVLAQEYARTAPRQIVVDAIRAAIDDVRAQLLSAPPAELDPSELRSTILEGVARCIRAQLGPHYRRVINATGVILHTALGRAALPQRALAQIHRELAGYSMLQVDPETNQRARRDGRIESLLRQLTGAEAATVVNNNAAATSIVLETLARGREVIVSRGQLVEIGGSFRLPDVMAASGAKLVEVGTTNKTHPRDYQRAITPNTAAILRVHPSNYKIVGFAEEVPLDELVRIAHANQLPLIDDLGAGALVDLAQFGFHGEPTLPGSVRAGADIVTASADKLIGASQGGIILGRADLVQAIRKNPMARIVRVGKLTLAALEATLTLFLDQAAAIEEIPTLRMLARPVSEIAQQAERIAAALSDTPQLEATTAEGCSQMGSGSLPAEDLPTRLVSLRPQRMSPDELALRLRRGQPPVFTRVQKGLVLIDPRTLLPDEESLLVQAVAAAMAIPCERGGSCS